MHGRKPKIVENEIFLSLSENFVQSWQYWIPTFFFIPYKSMYPSFWSTQTNYTIYENNLPKKINNTEYKAFRTVFKNELISLQLTKFIEVFNRIRKWWLMKTIYIQFVVACRFITTVGVDLFNLINSMNEQYVNVFKCTCTGGGLFKDLTVVQLLEKPTQIVNPEVHQPEQKSNTKLSGF